MTTANQLVCGTPAAILALRKNKQYFFVKNFNLETDHKRQSAVKQLLHHDAFLRIVVVVAYAAAYHRQVEL